MPDIFNNQKFIVANFKQSGDLDFMNQWVQDFKENLNNVDLNVNVVLCPSYPFLELFHREIFLDKNFNKGKIFIGSQNISAASNLENTGEVGAENIKNLIQFSIIGHSERKENYDLVSAKYERCLENKVVPILCFYENKKIFEKQNCIFAYEDPKSISKDGVYKEKSFNELMEVINSLKDLFKDRSVLYGGSVNKGNALDIKNMNFFSGVLVGRSSLNPEDLASIIKIFNS
jgi:triosephosphate isomerase